MIAKDVESKSSNDTYNPFEVDSQHVTLARALEEANAARDATFAIKQEMLEEIERFRLAIHSELKDRKRKFDIYDALLGAGLVTISAGIAVAFHWAYSLIVIGVVLMSLSILPLVKQPDKT